MGVGCRTVIEWRGSDSWHVLPERRKTAAQYGTAFDPVYIPRGIRLYYLLGYIDHETQMPSTEGAPEDMSHDLDEHIYNWEDADSRRRMRFMTLEQLRAASTEWDRRLAAEGIDPATAEISLHTRVLAAERAAAEHETTEVRMVYWWSS